MTLLYRTLRIAALALATAASAQVVAQSTIPRVLGATVQPRGPAKALQPATVQSRTVRPDVAAISALAHDHLASPSPRRVVIDLFPGLEIEAQVVAAEARANGGVTVFARLAGADHPSVVFTVEAGVVTATVDAPFASYVVQPLADGTHEVARKAAQLYPPELEPRSVFRPRALADPFTADVAPDVPADSGRLIDVMLVWTPVAEAEAGGLAAMQSLAQAAIDNANLTYLNSGIAQRLRLVHRQQVAYAERASGCPDPYGGAPGSDTFLCALFDLTSGTYGPMPAVHGLRDAHGADLVALLIRSGGSCGVAWLPTTPSEEDGFSVTGHDCAVGNKSFVHELGHNMGAHHDPANASNSGPKPFNKGFVSPTLAWRTVMAYPGACGGCMRVSHFSNPKLTYNGQAMGTAAVSNNAHVLNATAKAIAAYRPTSPLHPVGARFTDVAASHPFFGHIEFFAQAQISSGCTAGQFCPDAPVTRRMMAAFLERGMRASNWLPPTTTTAFTDVAPGSQFAGEIEALRNDGVTSGCTATTYCPEQSVSRAQMAAFVLRARCGSSYSPNLPASATFADVPLSHAFARYIEKMYALGYTGGCAAGPLRYCPDQPVTRGQMAVFVERAYPFLTPSETCSL